MPKPFRFFVATIAVLLCGLVPSLFSAQKDAAQSRKLDNAFFVLSNGVADEAHPTPESQAALLKEMGCSGIAPSGTSGVPEMLAALDAQGLDLTALYVGANLDDGQPKYDAALPDVIKKLSGRPTFIWLYIRSKQFKPSTTDGDERAVEIVREVAQMAKESGLRVAIYPHTGFYVQRVEDAVRVADKVDLPNVGVTFNLCHWLKVDGPNDLDAKLRLALPRLFLVTINGADSDGTNWDRLIQPLDCGTFNVFGLLKKLIDLGYKGPIGLQCYAVPGDKKENLRRSMVAWREYSKRMAGTDQQSSKPDRWEPTIEKFEAKDRENPPVKGGIVFIGSSSIVKWDLSQWFADLPVLNRGFGGSQIADSVKYADRILINYQPKIVVFYAGDNDIAAGKSPQQVLADYRAFVAKVKAALPDTRIVYIAIKPSIRRWHLIAPIREANRLIQHETEADPQLEFVDVDAPMLGPDGKPRAELFVSDGLHMSRAGYDLWVKLLRPHLKID